LQASPMDWLKKFRASGGHMGFYHKDKFITEKYTLDREKVLGKGMCGFVVRARSHKGEDFAVKLLERGAGLSDDDIQEVSIFAGLNHPNVAKLVEVFEEGNQNKVQLSLVMELLEGDKLFARCGNKEAWREKDAADACSQMCQAVNYLHTRRRPILHRDLKPENWMYLTQNENLLKLIDFGNSIEWNRQAHGLILTNVATPAYAAPEVMQQRGCTETCDIFSLGVILYTLLTGIAPFGRPTERDLATYKTFERRQYATLSDPAKSLLKSMLDFDPTQRPSAKAILENQWIERARQDSFTEPMDPNVIMGIKETHFQTRCLNTLAWSLQGKEIEELQKAFAQFDANQVGTLSLNEFRRVMEDKCSIHGVEAAQTFASFQEQDNPGETSYIDFLAAVKRKRLLIHQKTLYSLWTDSCSIDEGSLESESLQKMFEKDFKETDISTLLQELHPSSTGAVSFQSFQACISSLVAPSENVADEKRHRTFLDMVVHLIDKELLSSGGENIATWPCGNTNAVTIKFAST